VQLGFRVGGEGSNITGDIRMPAASPAFTYKVQTNWIVYQEAALKIGEILEVDPRARGAFSREGGGLFALFAAGVAESGTSVKGTSGMFSVTDNAVRSGMTFSAGAGIPLFMLANGVGIDGLVQYRGILWSSAAAALTSSVDRVPSAQNAGRQVRPAAGGERLRGAGALIAP
jgi:hypothetical protein